MTITDGANRGVSSHRTSEFLARFASDVSERSSADACVRVAELLDRRAAAAPKAPTHVVEVGDVLAVRGKVVMRRRLCIDSQRASELLGQPLREIDPCPRLACDVDQFEHQFERPAEPYKPEWVILMGQSQESPEGWPPAHPISQGMRIVCDMDIVGKA